MTKKGNSVKKATDTQLTLIRQDEYPILVCPCCSSKRITKAGFKRGKQKYKCKDCNRRFVNNPSQMKLIPLEKFEFEYDIWSAGNLGLKISPSLSNEVLNFSSIKYEWLKFYVKKFILFNSSHKKYSTLLRCYLPSLKAFSMYLVEIAFAGEIQDINREIITGYISYLRQKKLDSKTINFKLGALSLFFTTGITNKWFKVEPYLIREGDSLPKTKSNPRFIPNEVMSQLNKHLDKLPEQLIRMVIVIQECGLRVGELLTLKFDCLRSTSQGNFYLNYFMIKMNKEDTKPISKELVAVIREQQEYIRNL